MAKSGKNVQKLPKWREIFHIGPNNQNIIHAEQLTLHSHKVVLKLYTLISGFALGCGSQHTQVRGCRAAHRGTPRGCPWTGAAAGNSLGSAGTGPGRPGGPTAALQAPHGVRGGFFFGCELKGLHLWGTPGAGPTRILSAMPQLPFLPVAAKEFV